MSDLPQRRKSPEEIARLREQLGIPGEQTDVPASMDSEIPAVAETSPAPALATPSAPTPPPRQVHSLKKSEQGPLTVAPPKEEVAPPKEGMPTLPLPKPVRSLRKSEQRTSPAKPAQPKPDSILPAQRRSDHELNELRRRAALDAQMNSVPPRPVIAHPALYVPGYLFALAGAVCIYQKLPWGYPLLCELAALLLAAFVFFKRTHSRHHAAFIAAIALLVIIFGALYYFPQLRHAS